MKSGWNNVMKSYSGKIPSFNKFLLSEFRESKLEQIPEFLDALYKQSIHILDSHYQDVPASDRLEYIGYRELSPDELISARLKSKNAFRRRYNIARTYSRTLRYEFRFQDKLFHTDVRVPIIVDRALIVEDIAYYPIFMIIERGGLVRKDDEVTMQLLRANIRFNRSDKTTFVTMSGRVFREHLVQCRIHQKSKKRPPVVLYYLAKYGLTSTLDRFGMKDPISVSNMYNPEDSDNEYIHVKNSELYLIVNKESISDQSIQRMILSLLHIYKHGPVVDIHSVFIINYYRIALGMWTETNTGLSRELLGKNATYHLQMNDSILDPASVRQHNAVGIKSGNIDDLVVEAFFSIDKWLSSSEYQGTDLFDKKIGALDQMMSSTVQEFNRLLFNKVINSKTGLTKESVRNIMLSKTKINWVQRSSTFASASAIYGDNYLLAIGAKRVRSKDNVEVVNTGYTQGMNIKELTAHYSQLIVESVLCYPSSNPVISGTINPYLEIDEDGNIVRPDDVSDIEKVFD